MFLNLRIYLLLSISFCYGKSSNVLGKKSLVQDAFKAYGLVPDVIEKAPNELATVYFPSGVEAVLGEELTPTQVKDTPVVAWNPDPECFYTLAMVDPDASSSDTTKATTGRQWQHWLVGNIPGAFPSIGDTLAEYVGAAPPSDSGLHRYVILVFKQPSVLVFDEPRLNNTSAAGRPDFSIAEFAEKYKLGDPVAGNFFRAKYDNYVPILMAQLGDYSLLPLLGSIEV